MAEAVKENIAGSKRISKAELLAKVGEIRTAQDFARFMATLMAALIAGEIDAATGNAICKAASSILKAIEMQLKFGGGKPLLLTEGESYSLPQRDITPKLQPDKDPRTSRSWCQDCYTAGSMHTKATEEYDGDPLCLPHYNKRRKEDGGESDVRINRN